MTVESQYRLGMLKCGIYQKKKGQKLEVKHFPELQRLWRNSGESNDGLNVKENENEKILQCR